MSKKNTTEEFIKKAKVVHNDKYDYSKVNYINAITKVCIICPQHGEFWQIPYKHLIGQGCPKCGEIKRIKNNTNTFNDFLEKAKRIHNDKYSYQEIEKWDGLKTTVSILCPIHGYFSQKCNKHLQGQGCPKCGQIITMQSSSLPFEKFKEKAMLKHNNKYEYNSQTYVNATHLVEIICPQHGVFWQEGQSHLQGHGCPKCNQKKLERELEIFLIQNNIQYIFQAKKRNLVWLNRQSFDFYLPEYNIAIECQGEQHFKQKFNFNGHISTESDLNTIIERDLRKFQLAKINNVQLLYYTYQKWFPKKLIDNRLQKMYQNIFFTPQELIAYIKQPH